MNDKAKDCIKHIASEMFKQSVDSATAKLLNRRIIDSKKSYDAMQD